MTALQAILSAAVLLAVRHAVTRAPAGPGAQLRSGMVLVYESDGAEQPPWTVDSVRLGAQLLPGARCAVVHLRRRPDTPAPEELRLCAARDTLYRWDAAASRWVIARPVGPGMVWTTTQTNGDMVRFETGSPAQETVSGLPLQVVPTTITTTDSLGRPKRRLRERYALTLATATGGVFESPDSTAAGAWVARQAFELRRIQVP